MSDLMQRAHYIAMRRIATYKAKYEQGPDVFIIWYRRERRNRELPYPHEVYPELRNNLAFYKHPAWEEKLQ